MDVRFTISSIRFFNPDNGYSVLLAKPHEENVLITVVGTFLSVRKDMDILATGDWINHPRYGRQLSVTSWQEVLPETTLGIEKYLSSGFVKGIGPKYAHLIVEKFGVDTMAVIDKEISRLLEIPGIGAKRVSTIRDSWQQHQAIKNIIIFLQSYNVSTTFAVKIYKKYGEQSIEKVKANPYRLAEDIIGIGFKLADEIALNMGYERTDPRRVGAGILHTLNMSSSEGHVYVKEDVLKTNVLELLEIEESYYSEGYNLLKESKKIVQEDECIYLPYYYYAEEYIAKKIISFTHNHQDTLFCTQVSSCDIEKITRVNYNENQRRAIISSLQQQIMILTGGPGTGKTTTVHGIIALAEHFNMKVLLAAPTGRAAKRMKEATKKNAKTIHRLLEYTPTDGYQRNEENPLAGDVLIVDECSMIDVLLMSALLRAIPMNMKVILVGDSDQLPSVGAGNVLNDLIASGHISVEKLTQIFRQAQNSRIITNAHRINSGYMPDLSNGNHSDFFFIPTSNAEEAATEIVNLVVKRLPHAYHVKPEDIQVLTPMKKGVLGTMELNNRLQQELNPSGISISYLGYVYRVRDKVMQIRNNYDKNVFNGDIGFITFINLEDSVCVVNFDGVSVRYDREDLDELVPAYACTIHKSQGSEFAIVVLTSSMSHYVMLQRNLLYTGITRAKKICVIVGEKSAVYYSVNNTKIKDRNSNLIAKLQHQYCLSAP